MIVRLMTVLDYVNGSAWSFLVRGMVCQVNSDNARDFGFYFAQALTSNVVLLWSQAMMELASERDCKRYSLRRDEAITGL